VAQPQNEEPRPALPPLLVRTRQIWIQNVGRASINKVEVVLNYPPQHYEIWPQRQYNSVTNPVGNLIILVESLAATEYFTISMLDGTKDLPNVTNVRCTEGTAKHVPMGPQRILPRYAVEGGRILIIFGGFSAIYWLIRAVQWLA
jgi:hypothetical protein